MFSEDGEATAGGGAGGLGATVGWAASAGEAAAVGCSGRGGGVVGVSLATHWPFLGQIIPLMRYNGHCAFVGFHDDLG